MLQVVEHFGARDHVGHLACADGRRQDHPVRTSLAQLWLGLGVFAAGDDGEPCIQIARRQGDEHVHRIVRQNAAKCLRPVDAHRVQRGVVTRVSPEGQAARFRRLEYPLVIRVDHDHVDAGFFQILTQHPSDTAIAAYDNLIAQLLDLLGHTQSTQSAVQLTFCYHLEETTRASAAMQLVGRAALLVRMTRLPRRQRSTPASGSSLRRVGWDSTQSRSHTTLPLPRTLSSSCG